MSPEKENGVADDAQRPLRVAAIGDLHTSETKAHAHRELFAEVSDRADLLALCGDLTNHGKPREAELLAEDLRSCRIPVVGVLGNHDYECGHLGEITQILRDAGLHLLEQEPFTQHGVGIVGVKGFAGGFDARMLGAFGEDIIKRFVAEAANEAMQLENAIRGLTTERVLAVLHYAPIAATVEGEPCEIFPFLGSSRLADAIDRFPNVCAVVHGHAHHGSYSGRTAKGVPVFNCAYEVAKDGGRPYALITI